MSVGRKILQGRRRIGASLAVGAVLLFTPSIAAAEGDPLAAEPVVAIPSELPSLEGDPLEVEETDPLPEANIDPEGTTEDVEETLTGDPDTDDEDATGDDPKGDGATRVPDGSAGTADDSSSAGDTGGSGTSSMIDGDSDAQLLLQLAPAKSYTSVVADGAFATAERALRLARPLAPPLMLAGFALAILIAVARGNDRLVHVETAPEQRTYKL